MTSPVPKASDSGRLRRGSLTSPAVNVTLFQASAEKSEPTWATQTAINIPSAPPVADTVATNDKPDLIGEMAPIDVHKCAKLAVIASAFRPTKTPRTISATSDRVFAEVKMFWMILPSWRPRVFTIVKHTMIRIATNCWVERLTAYLLESIIGETIHCVGEMTGISTPRKRANATATAAIVPV